MTQATPETQPRKKSRIAGFFLPSVKPDSALLPSDRWILSNMREIFRGNKELRRGLAATVGFAVAGAAVFSAGMIGMVAFGAVLGPVLTIGAGLGTLGISTFLVDKMQARWDGLKLNVLPSVRREMTVRYGKLQGQLLAEKLKRRPAPEKKAEEKPKPVAVPVAEEKPAEKKPEEAATSLGKFGQWALKKAMEKAQAPKKTDETPKPPEVPKNPPPQTPPAP